MTALEKAQAAMDAAKGLEDEHGEKMPPYLRARYFELLDIGRTQAAIAQAIGLDRQANILERIASSLEAREEARV